ncbi:MAG: hypothetical protein RLW62_01525 [Gammaproteobacteria bacterium]
MKKLSPSRRTALCLGVALAAPLPASAAAVVLYTFDDAGGAFVNQAASVAANLTASAWGDADGTLTSLRGVSGDGNAIAARSWHDINNFAFTLSVATGFRLDLAGFSFEEQGSSGGQGLGPTSWNMRINGFEVAGGDAFRGNPGDAESGLLALAGLTGNVLVEIFASGAETSSTTSDNAANATWRIDTFSFDGAVSAVPLPPAVLLAAPALLGLAGWRRRVA